MRLASFVQHRHNDVHAAGLTADGGDDALQVLVVVVGAHGNVHPIHFVGNAVVENVGQDINIMSADGFFERAFGFSGAKPGAIGLQLVGVTAVSDKIRIVHQLTVPLGTPLRQVFIHLGGDFLTAFHSHQAQHTNRDRNLMNWLLHSAFLL